jgi:hypothetical protein
MRETGLKFDFLEVQFMGMELKNSTIIGNVPPQTKAALSGDILIGLK